MTPLFLLLYCHFGQSNLVGVCLSLWAYAGFGISSGYPVTLSLAISIWSDWWWLAFWETAFLLCRIPWMTEFIYIDHKLGQKVACLISTHWLIEHCECYCYTYWLSRQAFTNPNFYKITDLSFWFCLAFWLFCPSTTSITTSQRKYKWTAKCCHMRM